VFEFWWLRLSHHHGVYYILNSVEHATVPFRKPKEEHILEFSGQQRTRQNSVVFCWKNWLFFGHQKTSVYEKFFWSSENTHKYKKLKLNKERKYRKIEELLCWIGSFFVLCKRKKKILHISIILLWILDKIVCFSSLSSRQFMNLWNMIICFCVLCFIWNYLCS